MGMPLYTGIYPAAFKTTLSYGLCNAGVSRNLFSFQRILYNGDLQIFRYLTTVEPVASFYDFTPAGKQKVFIMKIATAEENYVLQTVQNKAAEVKSSQGHPEYYGKGYGKTNLVLKQYDKPIPEKTKKP